MMDTATDERVAYFGRGYNLAAHKLVACSTSALVAPAPALLLLLSSQCVDSVFFGHWLP